MRHKTEQKIIALGKKSKMAHEFINYLYCYPMVDSQGVADALSVDRSTSLRLIETFVQLDILKEITGYKRNRMFSFGEYVELLK